MQSKTVTIATHNGAFHADDVFAVAALLLLMPDADVVRTRDPQLIAAADFAVDVGAAWDPLNQRFDHHQKGFDGRRQNAVLYASAGLVWSTFGQEVVKLLCPALDAETVRQVAEEVDQALVQHLDMADTGAAQGAPGYFGLSALVDAFNCTREEIGGYGLPTTDAAASAVASAVRQDVHFRSIVQTVQRLLTRVVRQCADQVTGAEVVRRAPRVEQGRVLVLPEPGLSWSRVVCEEMPDVLLVVYPDSADSTYQVRTVPVEPESFVARRDLPTAWAGLRDAQLAEVTGVADAVFCHNGRFIAGAASKEGALRLAEVALSQ